MEMSIWQINFLVGALCISLSVSANIASTLVQSFPSNTVVSTVLSGIQFEHFKEKPSHVVKSKLSVEQFTSTVNTIANSYGLAQDVKNSILDGLHAEVNKEVVQQLKFTRGGPSSVIYGRIATMKRKDGTMDLAQAIHQVDFKLTPEIIHHKKKKRILGIVVRTKRWEEKKERTLSENDRQRLLSFVQGKALSGFNDMFTAQISGTCSADSGC